MNNHAPKMEKRIKGRRCPWLSAKIKKVMDEQDKILRKARKTRKDSDWSNYKQLKNQCNNIIKHAKRKYYNKLIANNSKNPKAFWKAVKEIFPTKDITSSLFTPSSIPEKISKANNFCSYFSLVAEFLKKLANPLKNFIWGKPIKPTKNVNTIFSFNYVSQLFVEKQLKSLKRKKAAGYDEIPRGFLKDATLVISEPLSFVINLSLSKGSVPNCWKITKIIPLHKGGTHGDMSNYCPIKIASNFKDP